MSAAQRIEAPTEGDIDRIAHQLIHAEEVVFRTLGRTLTGALDDLALLQRTLNASVIEREATYTLQALGIALLAFPQTMISKRIEDGTPIDVAAMYEGLLAQLTSIRAENYAQE